MGFGPAQGSGGGGGAGPTHLMPEQVGDPAVVLDAGTVYTKDVAGVSQLFYEDSGSTVTQLSGAGGGWAPGGVADNIQINDGAGGFGARLAINSSNQFLAVDGTLAAPGIVSTSHVDTGIAWDLDSGGGVDLVVDGASSIRYKADGSIENSPALANSTGVVHEAAAVQTTDATADVTLYSKTLADDTVYVFDVLVTCRDGAGTERAAYSRRVRAHRESAGVAVLGTIEASYTDESLASMDCTFTVSTNDIRVSVTGKAGTTINWAARVTSIGAE
jgi:hypothetical protein